MNTTRWTLGLILCTVDTWARLPVLIKKMWAHLFDPRRGKILSQQALGLGFLSGNFFLHRSRIKGNGHTNFHMSDDTTIKCCQIQTRPNL